MKKRILWIVLGLWFLGISESSAFLNPPQTLKVGEYTFEITEMLAWDSEDEQGRPVESLSIYLTVKREESGAVFDGKGNFYAFGDPDDPENSSLTNGTDISGDGEPDVVVAEYTYDPKGNLKFWVFSVGKDFRLLGKITAMLDGVPTFPDSDGDGKPEIPGEWDKV